MLLKILMMIIMIFCNASFSPFSLNFLSKFSRERYWNENERKRERERERERESQSDRRSNGREAFLL